MSLPGTAPTVGQYPFDPTNNQPEFAPTATFYDNGSVSAVLNRIGLTPPAVAAFMEVHMSAAPFLAMPTFLQYLRDLVGDSRTTPDPVFYSRMRFDALIPFATWDNDLDSETLVTLAIWYRAHDSFLSTFDWEHYLDPDVFEIYACTPAAEAAILLGTPHLCHAPASTTLFGCPTPSPSPSMVLLPNYPAVPLLLPAVMVQPSTSSAVVTSPAPPFAAPRTPSPSVVLLSFPDPPSLQHFLPGVKVVPTPAPASHHFTLSPAVEFLTSGTSSDVRILALYNAHTIPPVHKQAVSRNSISPSNFHPWLPLHLSRTLRPLFPLPLNSQPISSLFGVSSEGGCACSLSVWLSCTSVPCLVLV